MCAYIHTHTHTQSREKKARKIIKSEMRVFMYMSGCTHRLRERAQ